MWVTKHRHFWKLFVTCDTGLRWGEDTCGHARLPTSGVRTRLRSVSGAVVTMIQTGPGTWHLVHHWSSLWCHACTALLVMGWVEFRNEGHTAAHGITLDHHVWLTVPGWSAWTMTMTRLDKYLTRWVGIYWVLGLGFVTKQEHTIYSCPTVHSCCNGWILKSIVKSIISWLGSSTETMFSSIASVLSLENMRSLEKHWIEPIKSEIILKLYRKTCFESLYIL